MSAGLNPALPAGAAFAAGAIVATPYFDADSRGSLAHLGEGGGQDAWGGGDLQLPPARLDASSRGVAPQIEGLLRARPDEGAGETSGAGPSWAASAGGFNINIVPGAGLSANPAALAAFERAASEWEARLTDPITVTINADLSNLNDPRIIGQTSAVQVGKDYDAVRNALVADAADESDDAIVAALPTKAQVRFSLPSGVSNSGGIQGTKANLKAMGFTDLDQTNGTSDATITFNSGFAFDYDRADGVSSTQMDFETVAAHEIGHVLGFMSSVDSIDSYLKTRFGLPVFNAMPLDLFRFQNDLAGADPATTADFTNDPRSLKPGVDAITDGISGWSGAAAENRMSTGSYTGDGNQASHWKDADLTGVFIGAMDPTLDYGQTFAITDADWRAMDLIGWDVAGTPVAGISVSPLDVVTTEDGGTASFNVVLNTQPTAPVTIVLASGNASEGALVGAASDGRLTLTFTPENWSTPQGVAVRGVDDAVVDGDVAYAIVTSAAQSTDPAYQGINPADVRAVNRDNDLPTLSINDVAKAEGPRNANTAFTFTVSLPKASTQSVSVRYATANGTATTGNKDYVAASGTLTFSPGQTSKTVTVTVKGDRTRETDETFFVNLSNASGATISDAQGVGTIVNDD